MYYYMHSNVVHYSSLLLKLYILPMPHTHMWYTLIPTSTSIRYSLQRKSFNQPISSLYAIQAKLADMSARIDAARLANYRDKIH